MRHIKWQIFKILDNSEAEGSANGRVHSGGAAAIANAADTSGMARVRVRNGP